MAHPDPRHRIEQFNDEPIEIDLDGDDAIDLSEDEPTTTDAPVAPSKITTFGSRQRHEDHWDRTPNTTGQGAIHCKVFHCKLREDALEYLEKQVNEWLDQHPQYEVKQVTACIGEMKTKTIAEQAMFMTVWV